MIMNLIVEADGEESSALIERVASVGRADDADVTVPDRLLARHHFSLTYRDGAWWIRDADSPSGTWLDGQMLQEEQRVEIGQEIRAGGTTFTLRAVADTKGDG